MRAPRFASSGIELAKERCGLRAWLAANVARASEIELVNRAIVELMGQDLLIFERRRRSLIVDGDER